MRFTRSVVVPIAVAIPLLGITLDLLTAFVTRDPHFPPPWRNPGNVTWCLWAVLVPLMLRLEQRWPLPSPRSVLAHAASFVSILAVHLVLGLYVNAAATGRTVPRGAVVRFLFDLLPHFAAIDLSIYALIVAAAYALRSHFVLRQRERTAAALEADVRRAEVRLVRHNLEPEHVFRELAALRDDIGHDSMRAERRLEALSDHLQRQLDTVALLADEAREPLQEPVPEHRLLGLSAHAWLVLLIAPFAFRGAMSGVPVVAGAFSGALDARRVVHTAIYPIFLLPPITVLVAATLPYFRSAAARALHGAAVFLLCLFLSFTPDALAHTAFDGRPLGRRELVRMSMKRSAALNRLFFIAVAAGVLAAQYARRTRDREIDEAMLRARLADAQLSALRMQLHPHFLFNTLNTVAGLLDDDPAAARLMTERLDRFLRMSLNLGDAHEVPLRDELRFVMTYLEIQRARFGERLRIRLDTDDRAPGALVPPLVLQPLVENAVRHGIGPRKSGGTISIRAAVEGDLLALTVSDDGGGAPAAAAPGIGLTNTRARLRQLYGARQSVTIRTTPGSGFAVALQIPARFAHA